jgi:hypothetical protein
VALYFAFGFGVFQLIYVGPLLIAAWMTERKRAALGVLVVSVPTFLLSAGLALWVFALKG